MSMISEALRKLRAQMYVPEASVVVQDNQELIQKRLSLPPWQTPSTTTNTTMNLLPKNSTTMKDQIKMKNKDKGDKPKVFFVGPSFGIERIFNAHGWERVFAVFDADLVQFTGGADVTPSFYGQGIHKRTHSDLNRDIREKALFNSAIHWGVAMAGICRGGQFLNVMCGGELWQDVDNHAISGTHEVIDEFTGEVFNATSTHHQMMKPSVEGLLVATASESKCKESVKINGSVFFVMPKDGKKEDPEIVYYKKQNCLCFQPHPELVGHDKLADIYFHYIQKYCFGQQIVGKK